MLKATILALALASAPFAIVPSAFAASTLATVDTDKDGTIDVNEAQTAAGAVFDKLDADHDGTLDAKELKGRISKKDLGHGRSGQRQDNHARRVSRLCRNLVQSRRQGFRKARSTRRSCVPKPGASLSGC